MSNDYCGMRGETHDGYLGRMSPKVGGIARKGYLLLFFSFAIFRKTKESIE